MGKEPKSWHQFQGKTFIGLILFIFVFLIVAIGAGPLLKKTQHFESRAATIDSSITPPSDLRLVGLDSTIRAYWTPSTHANIQWHIFTVWEGSTLINTKVLSKTANVADANGLAYNANYTIKVQAMSTQGTVSNAIEMTGRTNPQSPMRNAAFYENFNESMHGDADPNYFDVRGSGTNIPLDVDPSHKRFVSINERHFHTQVIGGENDSSIMMRPRVPFDFTNRTGTIQFESDLPPVQATTGKWLEVLVTKDIPGTDDQIGNDHQMTGLYPNSIEFGMHHTAQKNSAALGERNYNIAIIRVNIGGIVREFVGTKNLYTPVNVRVPIVLKMSATSAEMFVNGESVVRASGFTLPSNGTSSTQHKYHVAFAHRTTYSTRLFDGHYALPMLLQLIHWETIQYDGPAGSYNPVVRSFRQSGCPAVASLTNYNGAVQGCPWVNSVTLPVNIQENISSARSARILFYSTSANPGGTITVNGQQMAIPKAPVGGWNVNLIQPEIPVSWLKQGSNQVTISSSSTLTHAQLEIIFNQPRTIGNPPLHPMQMIAVTHNNFKVEHLQSESNIHTITSYLYSSGASGSVSYSAEIVSQSPWLSIVSPRTGTLQAITSGGSIVPFQMQVNMASIPADPSHNNSGQLGVIKITGGTMPAYIAIQAINYGGTTYANAVKTYTLYDTSFKVESIPDYSSPGTTIPAGSTLPSGSTGISLIVKLHGLGMGGDNVNVSGLGNTNPLTKNRSITVDIQNASGMTVQSASGTVSYTSGTGDFRGTLPVTVQSGSYTMKAKMSGYLSKPFFGIQTITQGSNLALPIITLTTGDTNNDNMLSILDYNLLLDCFSDLSPARNCADAAKKQRTDITDDGAVNQFDYNLFLRELSVQAGG